jgi:CRISPR-associated protein Cas2
MYVIVVYDVTAEKTDEPRTFLRKHLHHVQNSVFEGEITKANLVEIKKELEEMAATGDSIFIYETWGEQYIERTIIGDDPLEDNQFI